MEIYEILYSTSAGGMIQIEAESKEDALRIFNNMDFEKLFEIRDLSKGIEIEAIN